MLDEVHERVQQHNSVSGQQRIQMSQHSKVRCDASGSVIGTCVKMDNAMAEDTTWLQDINNGADLI